MRFDSAKWAYFLRTAPRYLLPVTTVLCLCVLALLIGWKLRRRLPAPLPSDHLIVNVLNVGHGEATWIRTPGGRFIVIGGGPPGQGEHVLRSLRRAQAKKIDLLILPYPYAEAIGGVPEILSKMPVDQVWEPGGPAINQWQNQVRAGLNASNEGKTSIINVRTGQNFQVDHLRFEVLAPSEPFLTDSPVAANNSIVLRATFGDTRFLWAGGLEAKGEVALLARIDDLNADWLRVARFANRNASSPEFLRRVSAETIVVSVGPNRSGYPHPETMKRLAATGAIVYRTDTQATSLQFVSDGQQISGPY